MYSQSGLRYPHFEIFTYTDGSSEDFDSVRIEMRSIGRVWGKFLTSRPLFFPVDRDHYFDFAYATRYSDKATKRVPLPDSSDNYGFWHANSGTSGSFEQPYWFAMTL